MGTLQNFFCMHIISEWSQQFGEVKYAIFLYLCTSKNLDSGPFFLKGLVAKDSQKSLANSDQENLSLCQSLLAFGRRKSQQSLLSNLSPCSPQDSDHPNFSGLWFLAPSSSSGPPAFCQWNQNFNLLHLDQRSANIFYQGPYNKCFKICRPRGNSRDIMQVLT